MTKARRASRPRGPAGVAGHGRSGAEQRAPARGERAGRPELRQDPGPPADRQAADADAELAALLAVDPPNLTPVVDDLEQAGLVERQPHPTDRRVKLVVATTEGGGPGRRGRRDPGPAPGRPHRAPRRGPRDAWYGFWRDCRGIPHPTTERRSGPGAAGPSGADDLRSRHVGPGARAAIPRGAPPRPPPGGPVGRSTRWRRRRQIRPRPAASGRARSAGACATAPARSNPHGMKTVTSTCGRGDLLPGEPARAGSGRGEDRLAARGLHLVGNPVPGVEGRVRPFEDEHPGPVPPADPSPHGVHPAPQALPSARPPRSPVPVAAPTIPMQAITSSSRAGSRETTCGVTPDDVERLLHGTRRHGADPAQVLRQDQIGIDGPDPRVVQRVDGFPRRHAGADRGIDLGRARANRRWAARSPRRSALTAPVPGSRTRS